MLLERSRKKRYLTVYDYGTGGIWYYMDAYSPEQINDKYPGLEVLLEGPEWIDDNFRKKVRLYDIDDEPDSFLVGMMKRD